MKSNRSGRDLPLWEKFGTHKMYLKNDKRFIKDIRSPLPKNKNVTKNTDKYYIDDTWIMDLLSLNDYGRKDNEGYR